MQVIIRYSLIILHFLLILFVGCKSEKNGKQKEQFNKPLQKETVKQIFRIVKPERNTYVYPGDEIETIIGYTGEETKIDSVQFLIEGNLIKSTAENAAGSKVIIPGNLPPGSVSLRILIFHEEADPESHTVRLKLTSGIEPEKYTYRVVKTYPHDRQAYTQGFEYHDGFLYEGTGNYGESSLRKVDLETGEILKFRNLDANLFGEGITRVNNKIYQITYRAQVGFVYDENSFELQRKIYYQIKEGWGLTNNNEHILMSDGSNIIYYMDTTYFSVVRKIEVYDNEGEVDMLNELELIDGILYANRYTTEEIVMIDPETGRLLGRIDLSGILEPKDRHPSIDYFNGIAYDKQNNRIFVTGKYWPKVYEVEFVKE